MRRVVVIAAALLLAGCSAAEPSATSESPSELASVPAPSSAKAAPSAPAESSAAPAPAESSSEAEPGECPDDIRSGVEETIRSQVDAFSRGDLAAARQFASMGFQSVVDERQFRTIIETEYSYLLEDPELEFVACVSVGDLAETLVRVRSEPPTALRYRLLLEDAGWRIDGASAVQAQEGIAA